jgi:nucleoid DNA-binding protein
VNKAELIEAVAKITCTKAEAGNAVNAVIDNIAKALKKGDSVTLVGFGTFSVKKRKARIGRNPQTGKEIKIAAKKVPAFKPGKELKETVR